ncbi:hypothetical protein BsWGS_12032 [Bradybaena similaris]
MSSSSSYSPCHVALVIMSAHSLLSHVQLIISEIDIPTCHEAKLFNIVSLGLPLPLFLSNLSIDITCSRPPLLITWPKNADCFLLMWVTNSLCELISLKTSSFHFLSVHGILIILL